MHEPFLRVCLEVLRMFLAWRFGRSWGVDLVA